MPAEPIIPARFKGPPDSGNGGYSCGLLAAHLDGPAEVELRAPPPLERELRVEGDGSEVTMHDRDRLIAVARPAKLELELPAPVSFDHAVEASRAGYERWSADHPFPTCVVCGPQRPRPDGLGIYPGRLERSGRFAAAWVPDQSLTHRSSDEVLSECVWAALDCPTSAPCANFGEGPPIVLASLAAQLERPVKVGERLSIVSWPLAADGRKRWAGEAMFDDGGGVVARARALWIELRE